VGRTSCKDCVKVWQAYEKPTPCETCRPALLEDAQPYLHLYNLCSDQYIVGPGGALGLNFLAVEKIALRAGVPDDEILDFYEKLRNICSTVLEQQYEESERKRKQK